MKSECDAKQVVKSKRISQRIGPNQNIRLIKASKQYGMSCAELVRIALENYLNSLGVNAK